MPSIIVNYGASGIPFVPLLSGNPWLGWSGHNSQFAYGQNQYPVGGIQLRAYPNNSGNCYVSLSGAWVFSGVIGCLPGSGGPTITSGLSAYSGAPWSGYGSMDGMPMAPGDTYFIPKMAVNYSGPLQVCVGCDATASGTARMGFEIF